MIELTAGCTYGQCNFCNLYKNEPFRMVALEQFEEDLQEIKDYQPHARRLFLTVRDYLIKCQSIAMFASIRDIQNKEVWQLRKLRAMGVNGLSVGTESGDDDTLALAGKGYTADDILKQCWKLDEAGIEYYFVYMTGLAGKGGGIRNAVNSARLFSGLNPFANSSSNFYPLSVYLPKERESAISELQYVMDHHSEEEMAAYRAGLKSLG